MPYDSFILILEAMAIYFLVLWSHSLRHRFGIAHFYALLGGITAVMSWVTDAKFSHSICPECINKALSGCNAY
jgi:hypothetical protein